MRSTLLAWAGIVLAGCAGAQAPAPVQSAAPAASRPPSRDFAEAATFGDLVAAASAEETVSTTTKRCLLSRHATGFRLEGELAVAIHPISPALEDFEPILQESKAAQLLSRWGRYGTEQGALKLAALSDTPPTQAAHVLLLTDQGAYLRDTHSELAAAGPVTDTQIPMLLQTAAKDPARLTLFVTAESHTSIARLYRVLEQLGTSYQGPVALALVLAPDTILPAPRATTAAARRCPDGLGESDNLEGDLSVSALTAALTPLKARAASCLEHADARGAAGGRLMLALRIRPDGSVDQACMIADETGDDALAACVLAAASDLSFEAPSPAGFVDVELPLLLRPNSAPAQAPVCAVTEPSQVP